MSAISAFTGRAAGRFAGSRIVRPHGIAALCCALAVFVTASLLLPAEARAQRQSPYLRVYPERAELLKNSFEFKVGPGYLFIPFTSVDKRATNINNLSYQSLALHFSISYEWELLWLQVKYMTSIADIPTYKPFTQTPFYVMSSPSIALGLTNRTVYTGLFSFDIGAAAGAIMLNYYESYLPANERITSKLGLGVVAKVGLGFAFTKKSRLQIGTELEMYFLVPEINPFTKKGVNAKNLPANYPKERILLGVYPYISYTVSF